MAAGRNLRLSFILFGAWALSGCAEPAPSAPPPPCVPGQARCTDGAPEVCTDDGNGFEAVDPCDPGFSCDDGECVADDVTKPDAVTTEDISVEEDVVETGCEDDKECELQVEAGPCEEAICEEGVCGTETLENGSDCADGVCVDGACVELVCTPGEQACSADSGGTGEVIVECNALGTGTDPVDDCDDGDACTGLETCTDGECVDGEALVCEDDNLCTDDGCHKTAGCFNNPNAVVCDDGDVCTQTDVCGEEECTGDDPLDCDDGVACTGDSCDPVDGCVNDTLVDGDACDDGNQCTEGDSCLEGECQTGTPIDCSGGVTVPCTVFACSIEEGCLPAAPALPGAECDDDDACTFGDVCDSGACAAAGVTDCDDENPCTQDSCDAVDGCQYVFFDTDCDDGDPCTLDDYCLEGLCNSGTPAPTNDCDMPVQGTCPISGGAGSSVVCPLDLVRETEAVNLPTGFQFDLNYDPAKLLLVQFQDEICIGANCFNAPVPPAVLSTGHTLSTNPLTIAEWDGSGKVILVVPGGAPNALTDAYLDAGGVVVSETGTTVLEMVFELLETVPAQEPIYLEFVDIFTSSCEAKPLPHSMKDGVVIVEAAADPHAECE